jgi:hypothetical protein
MSAQSPDSTGDPNQRQQALSQCDNEGGAELCSLQTDQASAEDPVPMPANGSAEVAALHVRVIALENLVISLLVEASESQLEQAREMARYISPRPSFTHHPLTTRAADHMIDLVQRASRFRGDRKS